jgi:putative flippase GtrA
MRTQSSAFWRFLVVGGAVASVSALAIMVLVRLAGLGPIAAASMVAIAGNVIGFVANRRWSFLAAHDRPLLQFLRYLAITVCAAIGSVVLFAALTEWAGLHYLVASLCVSATFAVPNFIAHYHWSFRTRSHVDSAP